MKFRKKHKGESGEVFTDSLNDILFILLMFFLIVATLANPNVVKVGLPRGTKDTKAKQNIMVSINKNQEYFIGTTKIESNIFDSMLIKEIRKYKAFVFADNRKPPRPKAAGVFVILELSTLSEISTDFQKVEVLS